MTVCSRCDARRLSSWIMRATSSLPDPVGPRIRTAMSLLAAVRIHSRTTNILSSVPISSRNRCTAGERSSGLDGGRRSRKASISLRSCSTTGGRNRYRVPCSSVSSAAIPKATSSRTQFSMSRRIRPNACMRAGTSNGVSCAFERNRSNPARRGDCTSAWKRSSTSSPGAGSEARMVTVTRVAVPAARRSGACSTRTGTARSASSSGSRLAFCGRGTERRSYRQTTRSGRPRRTGCGR